MSSPVSRRIRSRRGAPPARRDRAVAGRRAARQLVAAVTALAAAAGLAGCTTPTAPQTEDGTLAVRVAAGLELPQAVLDRFHDETGVTVTVDDSATADELSQQVHDADTDLVIGVNTASGADLSGGAGLVSYVSPRAGDGAGDFALDGGDRLTALSYDVVCVAADDAALAARGETAPTSLMEALDRSAELVAPDPAAADAGRALLAMADHAAADQTALDAALDRLDQAVLTDTAEEATARWAAADAATPLVAASAPALLADSGLAPVVAGTTSLVTGSCVEVVDYAGIVARSPHVNEARKLIDLLLADDVQGELATAWHRLPVQRAATVPETSAPILDDYARLDSSADLGVLAARMPTLVDAWRARD